MTAVLERTRRREFFVHSKPDALVYLVMEECADGYGVLIRPTKLAKSNLGSYWKVWVRDWTMKLDAKYVKTVKFSSKGVWFVSDQPLDEWVWTLQSLLANVRPLGRLPMRTMPNDSEGFWKVDRTVDLTAIINDVRLPDTVRRFFSLEGGNGFVILHRYGIKRDQCPFPIREVKHMVELQVALACARDGIPPNEEYLRRRRLPQPILVPFSPMRHSQPVVVTVELPPLPPRQRRRTIRGVPVERRTT